eukprot:COSAG06_NODE_196_length_20472_cov_49.724207_18_plen_62_part_00
MMATHTRFRQQLRGCTTRTQRKPSQSLFKLHSTIKYSRIEAVVHVHRLATACWKVWVLCRP